MKGLVCSVLLLGSGWAAVEAIEGSGQVLISGDLKQWHNITLTLDGPFARESDTDPNPFVDIDMRVRFEHVSGSPNYVVPAYFAADGNAAETSATAGTKWRAHLSPDFPGRWKYTILFEGTRYDGLGGSFMVAKTDRSATGLRRKGRLQYVGSRYLRHVSSREWFLKAGADSPETLLACSDFDGTVAMNAKKAPLKTWSAHVPDWTPADPVWQGGKGKGIIGAINYLAGKGCNAFSFIPYNAGGDGDNVWPHVSRADKLHFDCSKLDQWGIVFDHATSQGMFLHFKLQETENDDLTGPGADQALDKGELGIERKTYFREMVARFGHNLALNWNLGEENTQTIKQIREQARFIRSIDPYDHHIVLHTYPDQQDQIYSELLGQKDGLSGVSIQNSDVKNSHADALRWIERSRDAGLPWVIALDEAGNAGAGSPPDPDWPGMAAAIEKNSTHKKPVPVPTVDDVRSQLLWGTLMAGGMGVEYYFGYRLPENDLKAENWRSRDMTWDYSRIALNFFRNESIPFWEMENTDALVGNTNRTNEAYCFSKAKLVYLVYLSKVESPAIDLTEAKGTYSVKWFDPRNGGKLKNGSVKKVRGGAVVKLGSPPSNPTDDWVVLVRKK